MSHLIWNYEDLVEITKSEDKEVRYWAVDRLVRHFPAECCGAIAEFLLDEHDETPLVVARHLGEHGDSSHHSLLLRGYRVLRGLTPGTPISLRYWRPGGTSHKQHVWSGKMGGES